jgi:NRPS condensation-like uncharacterized protein
MSAGTIGLPGAVKRILKPPQGVIDRRAVMTTLANSANLEIREAFVFPASFGQKRIWPKNPREAEYNIPTAFRVLGSFDMHIFSRSVREVVNRHESLRTRFQDTDGEISQIIETDFEAEVPMIDLESESPETREDAARRLIHKEINAPFDLYSLPLWRVTVLRMGAQNHVLVVVISHIICDGWSIGLLLREVSLLYSAFVSGQPSPLIELFVQYADFSEWEREAIQDNSFKNHLAYWKEHLSRTIALNLPYDRPKGMPSPFRDGSYTFSLESGVAEKLTRLTEERHVSLNMILLAAYQTLLYRYTGQRDIVVGCNVARRTRPQVQAVIGLFAQPLVMRGKLSGELSFCQLLEQVREITVDGYAHQDTPFGLVLRELMPEYDARRPYIFQTMFNLSNPPPQGLRLGTAVIDGFEIDYVPKRMEISVFAMEKKDTISFSVLYEDMFNPETIAGMFQYYADLLGNIVDHPESSLDVLLSSTNVRDDGQ